MLAVALGDQIEIYKNFLGSHSEEDDGTPYLRHKVSSTIMTTQFCPFEDVLGLAHGGGFDSILVPGSAEANFDSLELNPLMSRKQRREAEVKGLLNKIQPELISLDPDQVSKVDVGQLRRRIEEQSQVLWRKPRMLDLGAITGKNKGTAKVAKAKEDFKKSQTTATLRDFHQQKMMQDLAEKRNRESGEVESAEDEHPKKPRGVLDRFRSSKSS